MTIKVNAYHGSMKLFFGWGSPRWVWGSGLPNLQTHKNQRCNPLSICFVSIVTKGFLSFWLKLPSWQRPKSLPHLFWWVRTQEAFKVEDIFWVCLFSLEFWVAKVVFIYEVHFLPYCSILYVWVIKSLWFFNSCLLLSLQSPIYACLCPPSSVLQHKSRPYCAHVDKFFEFSSNHYDISFHKI